MKKILTSLLFCSISCATFAQGTWTAVATNAPHPSGSGMQLLSDGTILVKSGSGGSSNGNIYDRLTPNTSGSYINGTWSSIAPMINTRLYYSTQLLKDGRMYVAGGEYGTGGSSAEVYNPLTNTWTNANAPGAIISDANSEILEDGRVLQAMVNGTWLTTTIYNPATNSFVNGPNVAVAHKESAWLKLPDNSILQVDNRALTSERYIPATNSWISDAPTPSLLWTPYTNGETGSTLLLPDGRGFFTGATGHNAYYTPSGTTAPGSWSAAPDFPNGLVQQDAPTAMMVNGKILCSVAPIPLAAGSYPTPTSFYEFDPTTNIFTAIAAPGGGTSLNIPAYQTTFCDLPDGKVLFARQGSSTYYIYTPTGAPVANGKPTINTITKTGTNTYLITGTGFNGLSEGANYGDDWQMNSNFPIVRLTNGTNVYYARTSNWNSTGVRRGTLADTATFTVSASLPNVNYSIYVVANGIPSDPTPFSLNATASVSIALTSGSNPSCSGTSITYTASPTNGGSAPTYQWKINGVNAGTNSSTFTSSALANGNIVTCVMTSNLPGVLGSPATSNAITMTVNNPVAPTLSIYTPTTSLCEGVDASFYANSTNGGTSPVYQWAVNGINDGTNSDAFTSIFIDGDVITCSMISNSTCITTSTALSNAVTVTVNPLPTGVTADDASGCEGSPITLTASPAGGSFSVPNPYTGPSTSFTYDYADPLTGCESSFTANISIIPAPSISFSGLAASYNVADPGAVLTGSPSGGSFSGVGISGSTFTPSVAGVGGPYNISYSYTDLNTGCSNSVSQQTSVTVCNAAPAGLSTSAITNTTVTLNWAAVSGATSYNIQYRVSPSGSWTSTTSTTSSKAISGLTQGTAYNFQVQAYCSTNGNGTYSSIANFTTTSGCTGTDAYETNNTLATAKPIAVNTDIYPLISSSTDKDYLSFTTLTSAPKLKVVLDGLPADYDLRLYNSSGTQIGSSSKNGTNADQITYNSATTGATYRAYVFGYNGAFNATSCYHLRVTTSATNIPKRIDNIDDNTKPGDMVIYPNPATDHLTVVLMCNEAQNSTINIVDMLGKNIYSIQKDLNEGSNSIDLNLSSLSKGIYIVKSTINGSNNIQKLVIEK